MKFSLHDTSVPFTYKGVNSPGEGICAEGEENQRAEIGGQKSDRRTFVGETPKVRTGLASHALPAP